MCVHRLQLKKSRDEVTEDSVEIYFSPKFVHDCGHADNVQSVYQAGFLAA
jgi:hypothetical protein